VKQFNVSRVNVINISAFCNESAVTIKVRVSDVPLCKFSVITEIQISGLNGCGKTLVVAGNFDVFHIVLIVRCLTDKVIITQAVSL
jgi:hypothetical protein